MPHHEKRYTKYKAANIIEHMRINFRAERVEVNVDGIKTDCELLLNIFFT